MRLRGVGWWWLLGAVLLAAALWVRWDAAAVFSEAGGIVLDDPDTLRRLVRLEAIDAARTYPIVETADGHPRGIVHHWTLPMDWVIRALDPPARLFWPDARRYAAGAMLAGPLLALVSITVLLAGARRLLGWPAALLAGLIYAFAYAFVDVSWLGNGDHQNLQHLALVLAMCCGLLALERRRAALAAAAGACLGLAVWVSTESMLVAYAYIAVLLVLSCAEREHAPWQGHARIAFSAAFAAVLALAHVLEHRARFLAFEYDKVSWFQLWQALVLLAFALLASRLRLTGAKRVAVAAVAMLALGLLPFALSGALRAAFAVEHARFTAVGGWLHNEVIEFRGLFEGNDHSFDFAKALAYEPWLVFALPVLLAGVARCARLRPAVRAALILLAVATFGFEVAETKLGHLFAMVFPLAAIAGMLGLADPVFRWLDASPGPVVWLCTAAALALTTIEPLPKPRSGTGLARVYHDWRAICAVLREEAAKLPPGAVLAPWDMGAHILYYAGLPVVASNYHRNLDGILDGHRAFLAPREQREQRERVLAARDVRLIVAHYDHFFLAEAPRTLGREPLARHGQDGFVLAPEARATFYFELREANQIPGLRLLREGDRVFIGKQRHEPIFRIWAR